MKKKLNIKQSDFEYISGTNDFLVTVPGEMVEININEARQLIAFINTHICYIPDKNTISALAYCDKQGLGKNGGKLMEGALWLRKLIEKRLNTEIPACQPHNYRGDAVFIVKNAWGGVICCKKNEKDAKIKVRQLIKSQKPYYFVGIYYEKHEIK